jgi:hypothetical protein
MYKKIRLNYYPIEHILINVLIEPLGSRAFREYSRKPTGL